MFVLLEVFIITLLIAGCNSTESVESVQSVRNFATKDLTLLERAYVDADSDGTKESVELYTSAKVASDGRMGWDTGHQWVLLVRSGEAVFPLFDDWVQYGEVQFWVVGINKNRIQGPESTELVRKIYVTVTTGVGMRLLGYYWDKQNLCYEKEVIFNPEDQWVMRHSNKYSIPDPYRIAPEQILEGK